MKVGQWNTSRLERQHERNHKRRAMEQSEARQSRLERLRKRNHKRRAMEQPEARQSRLERLREHNCQRVAELVFENLWKEGSPE